MVFWLGILVAAVFAYSAIKLGLYQSWTLLFNIVIAVYLAIHLSPTVEGFMPANSPCSKAMAILATGVGVFLILHGASYIFLLGQFEVTFPKGFSKIAAGVLGFLAGSLVWSFMTFVICTTPFCEQEFVKDIGFGSKSFEEGKMEPYLVWWCSIVDKFAAQTDSQTTTADSIKQLLTKQAKHCKKPPTDKHPGSSEPNSVPDKGTGAEYPDHRVIPP